MKQIILLISLLLPGVTFAQDEEALDTIYANESTNVSIFFPSQIRQGITGAPNFTFGYNDDNAQYFGLLKAVPGSESNLLVLTTDGQIYSYILKYQENLPRLNYFIDIGESIGNEIPQVTTSDTIPSVKENTALSREEDSLTKRKIYLGKLSAFYLKNLKGNFKTSRKDGLILRVKDIIYKRNDTFIVFEIENKSGIDFQLDYLNVYLTKGNKKRNASYQKLLKSPHYIYKVPEVIMNRQQKRFVYVLPKFTIGEHEKIEVEAREKKGSRFLMLTLKSN